ncbi:DapH/DapD/GlmU-related protein [Arthrobacter sp. 2RAF22]|uniref:acyltransferase n=1 Tax=Arthrobacter sp. 2RAF22 TaxID=3232996 RepID=UPI003F8DAC09
MGILNRLWPGVYRDVVLNSVIASPLFPAPLRWRALRAYGMQIEQSVISPGVWFGSSRVSIGAGSFINYGCMFNTTAPIMIGKACDVAMHVVFSTTSHEVGGKDRRAGKATAASITVGDGTWIGARAIILSGVTIGDGVVIAAGSVVNKDCKSHGLYAGVPARRIKDLPG